MCVSFLWVESCFTVCCFGRSVSAVLQQSPPRWLERTLSTSGWRRWIWRNTAEKSKTQRADSNREGHLWKSNNYPPHNTHMSLWKWTPNFSASWYILKYVYKIHYYSLNTIILKLYYRIQFDDGIVIITKEWRARPFIKSIHWFHYNTSALNFRGTQDNLTAPTNLLSTLWSLRTLILFRNNSPNTCLNFIIDFSLHSC